MTKILCGECIHNSDKGGGCLIPKNLGYVDNCNHYLPKDRPIVQTNEEWLRSATTEQLAEAIYYLTWFHTELDERLDKNVKNGCYNDDENIKIVTEWLKQPHREE